MHFEQTADNDIVSIYQLSSVQLVTDKKLEALNQGCGSGYFQLLPLPYLSLPLPLTKNKKTMVDHFFKLLWV